MGRRTPLPRKEGLRRMAQQLRTRNEIELVQFEPSKIRPREIQAEVRPTVLAIDDQLDSESGTLRVDYRPRADSYHILRIQYTVGRSLGWHQDDSHPELGPCHFQDEHTEPKRRQERVPDHPLAMFQYCLARLSERVNAAVVPGDSER